jgi:heme-degrading monooxygenase HmoA
MPEQKKEPQEGQENKSYEEFQAAMEEVDRIMQGINEVFSSTPDRSEAERIVLEKWAPLMDEALKKQSEAQKAWFNSMQKDK